METSARVVIVGAGIVGCSAAYHLAKMGWRDMILLDRGPLYETGGSTSHAPGLIFQTNYSRMMTEFARYTVGLFSELEVDGAPCYYRTGGIEIATSPARWAELKRKHGAATSWGLESHLIEPHEVARLVPLVDAGTIHGGYFVPSDGDARAWHAAGALAARAVEMGALHAYGSTRVTDLEVEDGRVRAVITDRGRIECEHVLLCTNIWAPPLPERIGLHLPLMAFEHQYVITEPLEMLAGETREIVHPIVRHQDHRMYFRQHADAYGVGSYDHEPLMVDPRDIGRDAMRPFTPEDFAASWAEAGRIMPPLAGRPTTTAFNGMFAFTPDGMPILGEAPSTRGIWVAVAIWVTHSGGAGRAIAELMTDGVASLDLREADINRFQPHAFSRAYYHARCAQQYREVYDIIHPLQQMEHPRNLRLSPAHERLVAQEAVFFSSAGWERPQWFEANARLLEEYDVPEREGWTARYWSPIQGAEHLATREGVGLFDLSAFAKIEVSGPGALDYLEYLAANRIDRPVGKVVYTALLNERGGIRSDLTITRLEPDRFLVLTGGGVGPLDLAWIRDHAPDDGSVRVADVSSHSTTFGLWGPRARDVLQSVTEEDLSNEAFPYFTAQQITVDAIPVLALRVSYAGELGWELYCPTEYGRHLWDVLWEAGRPFGIVAGGGGAFDSLRLEKGYRLWGADIHTEYNPYEAGLGWAVRLDKGDFLGRDALLEIRERGIARKLCCLTLDGPDAVVMGKEPILDGDRTLGYVTSANHGYSVGRFICYGYLPIEHSNEGTRVEIEFFGERLPATVRAEPLFDPAGDRLRT